MVFPAGATKEEKPPSAPESRPYKDPAMILRQTLHTTPAIASSYVFGCGSKSVGVVVDPVAHPQFYLNSAADLGMKVRYVIDTHVHADHLSTARDLADASGAEYVLHESVDAAFSFKR